MDRREYFWMTVLAKIAITVPLGKECMRWKIKWHTIFFIREYVFFCLPIVRVSKDNVVLLLFSELKQNISSPDSPSFTRKNIEKNESPEIFLKWQYKKILIIFFIFLFLKCVLFIKLKATTWLYMASVKSGNLVLLSTF